MPSASVLTAVQTFIRANQTSIPGLADVFTVLPQGMSEADIMSGELLAAPQGVGGVIYLFIETQEDRRIALGGATNGRKCVTYGVAMDCRLKSDLDTRAAAQSAFNKFRDGLSEVIRSNRNAGDPSVVFSWGEGSMLGGPDMHWSFAVPKTLSGASLVMHGICRVTVLEILDT
jgi:hypothetical protein